MILRLKYRVHGSVLSQTIRNLDPGNAKFAKSWFTGENPH